MWPESLVEDIARRRVVLFLGAGVSAGSVGLDGSTRPPNWEMFLRTCVSKCSGDTTYIQDLLDSKDYLTACELLKIRLRDEWHGIMADAFSRPQFRAAKIHEHLFRLDCRLVLTQNFDKIFDVYAQSETLGATVIKTYYDDDTPLVLRKKDRAIIKVHGSIDEASKTIFTRSDYAVMRHRYQPFQQLIDALFLTHTFLFVGCSLSDPDLRLFLEQHAQRHPSAPVHFITSPDGEIPAELSESTRRNMNLQILRYDPAENHAALTSALGHLVGLVDAAREELAERMDW